MQALILYSQVPEEEIIECHGHFRSASCTDCGSVSDIEPVRRKIIEDKEPPICARCGGLVKPDIV